MSAKQPHYPNSSTERGIIFTIIIIMFFAGYCMGQVGRETERDDRIEAGRE